MSKHGLPRPYFRGFGHAYDADKVDSLLDEKDARIAELQAELAAARKECEEQARLNGMGSEREAALYAEIERLRDSRRREGGRLDWLIAKLPGNVTRTLVGEMSETGNPAEWREKIDIAARFISNNAQVQAAPKRSAGGRLEPLVGPENADGL